jgi:hypothetical protein
LNWTLRKKIFWYYARIALGLGVLGAVALLFQKIIEDAGKYLTAGDWTSMGRILLVTLVAVPLVILLLYLVDKWYGNLVSRMSGQKGPPKE